MKATAEVKGRRSDSGLVDGYVSVDDGSEFEFEAKVYDDPSPFGIETNRFPGGGNISKLDVNRADNGYDPRILTYDRGWDYNYGETPYDSPIGKEKAEAIIVAIADELEKIVDGNTAWAKRYRAPHLTDEYGIHNYFMGTTAVFEPYPDPTRSPSFVSKSGSEYWYTDDGVIRRSNHWGTGIASCDWLLGADGRSSWDTTAPKNIRSGFCRFADFHPNGFYEVVVYGVDRGESDGENVNGTPYKVIAITPDLLRDGYVVTEYGKCKFNGMSFMSINFDGKKLPQQ